MKSVLALIAVLAACIMWSANVSLAACPEDPNDHGACDTLYAELYPPDALFTGPGHIVRVPLLVTNDISDAMMDSIAGMSIPLCYTRTNPTKYCSLSSYWNSVPSYFPGGGLWVVRDLDESTSNTFLDIYGPYNPGLYEDFSVGVSTADQYFRFAWYPTMSTTPRWPEGSQRLALMMTFRVEDSMTVCLDTCFWPPTGHLGFVRSDAVMYTPRDNMPYCFSISYPEVGDCNCDGIVDIGDVVYLIGYLYRGAAPPAPPEVGDANCDGIVNIGDVVRLIGYLFKGEPPPECP